MIHTLNDSRRVALVAVNLLIALASAVFGLLALVSPAAEPGIDAAELTSAATFFGAMYGTRALLIGAAVGWQLLAGRDVVPVLVLAGAVQVDDPGGDPPRLGLVPAPPAAARSRFRVRRVSTATSRHRGQRGRRCSRGRSYPRSV
jgi:hypothetical protein